MKFKIVSLVLLVPTMALALFIDRVEQTTWGGGPNRIGPVFAWGDRFWLEDSITYNIDGQVSPVGVTANYSAWIRHCIDSTNSIQFSSIVAEDFDDDSDMELAGWITLDNVLAIYDNDGAGNFTKVNSVAGPKAGIYFQFMCKGDLDGDGDVDVALPSSTGGLGWFENLGSLSFIYRSIVTTPRFNCVEAGDIDNDGDLDIGAVKYWFYVGGLDIYQNDGCGNFVFSESYSDTVWRLRFEDMNGDGNTDLVFNAVADTNGYVSVLLNDGVGYFNIVWSDTFWGYRTIDGLWTKDMNNDGSKDIFLGIAAPGRLYWYENDGTGTNYTIHTVFIAEGIEYGDGTSVEDLDMDGRNDILSAFANIGFFRQINSDSFIEYQIEEDSNDYSHWIIPVNLDWNLGADQDIDILVCRDNKFLWFENQMVNNYATRAWLESSVLDIDCDNTFDWRYFGWETCTPSANTLGLRVRAANDTTLLLAAPWSAPIYPAVDYDEDSVLLSTLITGNEELLQYRIDFGASPSELPVVYKIWVDYDCDNTIEEKSETKNRLFVEIYNKNIKFFVPDKRSISLVLYDIVGRGIPIFDKCVMDKGWHSVGLPELPTGLYFVRIQSDTEVYTSKFLNYKSKLVK